MSVTYGFYNAVLNNGVYDRQYTAEQLSSIFDGLVNDGVYQAIGSHFAVTPSDGLTVSVGSGRAWFEHTWTLNDAPINVTLSNPDSSLDRIDAVVIQVDSTARVNSIVVVKGALSSSPVRPTLTAHQHPLAYVRVNHQVTSIKASNITNAVGTTECPYVTGIVQVVSIDSIVAQWTDQWNTWMQENETAVQTRIDYLDSEIAQVEQEVGADLKPIVGYDISVPTSSWSTFTPASGSEEEKIKNLDYKYRATIPLANVLPSMRPYITLSLASVDASGASILNQYQCVQNGIYMYADMVPMTAITVLTAECRKTVV